LGAGSSHARTQGYSTTAHLDAWHVPVKAVTTDPDAIRGREDVDRYRLARHGPRVGRPGVGRRGSCRPSKGDPAALDLAVIDLAPVAKTAPFRPLGPGTTSNGGEKRGLLFQKASARRDWARDSGATPGVDGGAGYRIAVHVPGSQGETRDGAAGALFPRGHRRDL